VSQIFGDKDKIIIGAILIWYFGGLLLDAKWRYMRSNLACKVSIFMPIFGAQPLNCERESRNPSDLYAVAIKNGASVIGHIPRKLSAACSLFLSLGGTMNCEIMDNHR